MNKRSILLLCALSGSLMAQDRFDAAVCMAQQDLQKRQDCYSQLQAGDDSYKTWQPYLEYLGLPEQYHSPEMEQRYKLAYRAQLAVAGAAAKSSDSIEGFFAELATKPVVDDNGWNTFPEDDGLVLVERLVFVSGRPVYYRWSVDEAGTIKPLNGHAMDITE